MAGEYVDLDGCELSDEEVNVGGVRSLNCFHTVGFRFKLVETKLTSASFVLE